MITLGKLAGGAALLFALSAGPATADSYGYYGPGYYSRMHTVCDPDGRRCYSSYTREWSYDDYYHRGYHNDAYRDRYDNRSDDDDDYRSQQADRYYRNGDSGYREQDQVGPYDRYYGDGPDYDRDYDDDGDDY
ncbi:MAG TPA: hypothetical protein VGG10_17200 [Rhizomicrobium sp.]|jgi:hypothetical protein